VCFALAFAGLGGCGSDQRWQPVGSRLDLGSDVSGGRIVADIRGPGDRWQLAAGFTEPMEEERARGIELRPSLDTLCLFTVDRGDPGGGGCGGYRTEASINDEGCGNTHIYGLVPQGGGAVVHFHDGKLARARLYRIPESVGFGRKLFAVDRRGVHTVEDVDTFGAGGQRLRRQHEGADDVSITCAG
jgi:hypothetical protein